MNIHTRGYYTVDPPLFAKYAASGSLGEASVDTATGRGAEARYSSDRARSIFARIARRYDLFNALSSFGIYRFWLSTLVSEAEAGPSTEMLDLAAGTGDVTFAICRKTPPAHVVTTDFCKEMLDVARERYARGASHGVPCTFLEVDAQDTPFDDGTFDLVTCAYGIRNMPERMRALSEAYRVLKPGGRYVILEFSTPPFAPWRKLYQVYLKYVIPAIGWLLTGDREGFVYLGDSIRAFPDQDTLARALEQVGFKEVSYRNRTGGIVAVHTAVK